MAVDYCGLLACSLLKVRDVSLFRLECGNRDASRWYEYLGSYRHWVYSRSISALILVLAGMCGF